MELVLLAVIGAALFVTDRYADFMADQAAGNAFEQVHEVIGSVSYFGQSSRPVSKKHVGHILIPLCPSINHDFKVLSLTDCGHWFWFSAKIRMLRLEETKVEAATLDEARQVLQDEPEKLAQFFPETERNEQHKKVPNQLDS